MFRMWGKIFHENHMLKDTVICIDSDLNRTRKVYQALEEICYEFDLSKPLWLCLLYTSDRALHTEILLHSRGVAASGFPPLCNIPHCCLP